MWCKTKIILLKDFFLNLTKSANQIFYPFMSFIHFYYLFVPLKKLFIVLVGTDFTLENFDNFISL